MHHVERICFDCPREFFLFFRRFRHRVVHGLGWVACTIAEVLKIWKHCVNSFKTRLDKIWLQQAVKFDFTADLRGMRHRTCAESRDPWVGDQKRLHIWNPRPRFAYSLCNFYWATTTIKGRLLSSRPMLKPFSGEKNCPVEMGPQNDFFGGNGGLNLKCRFVPWDCTSPGMGDSL